MPKGARDARGKRGRHSARCRAGADRLCVLRSLRLPSRMQCPVASEGIGIGFARRENEVRESPVSENIPKTVPEPGRRKSGFRPQLGNPFEARVQHAGCRCLCFRGSL